MTTKENQFVAHAHKGSMDIRFTSQLAEISKSAAYVKQSGAFFVFVADLYRQSQILQQQGLDHQRRGRPAAHPLGQRQYQPQAGRRGRLMILDDLVAATQTRIAAEKRQVLRVSACKAAG